jgi:hypothetical protein
MEDAHVAAILEDVQSNFRVFGEALKGLTVKVDNLEVGMAATRRQVDVLGLKIDLVAKDVAIVKTDVAILKTDMGNVKDRLTGVELRLNGARVPRRASVRKRRK